MPDKTLLIHTEQGAGDAVQFARYVPLAAERCKKLILVCPGDLISLFATLPGIAEVREAGHVNVAEFDTWLPIMSLPRVFGTTLDSIPASVPYIDVDAIRRRKNKDGMPALAASGARKIGIAWAGSPTHSNDRYRSCALREFLPILRAPGCEFYSLQKGDAGRQLGELPADIRIEEYESRLHDLADRALLIAQLDLVISVDTSVVHLAGALGKPVWTLLAYVPDWRWGLEGETTLWYPTVRLFRQAGPGDWPDLMQRVARELAAWKKA